MATSPAEARAALIGLTDLARRDLFAIWQELSTLPAEQVSATLRDVLPLIGDQYGLAAAALAADWYDDLREAAEVSGRFLAEPAALPDAERYESLAGWATSPLYQAEPDPSSALALVWGGLQRTIADAHRLTIVDNSIRDPQASGWTRVGVGDNCGFCRMLIDRGHVYTEASVTFRSHDHCNCAASPSWAPNVVKVSSEPFRQSKKNRSPGTKERDNARARAYIAAHYGG